MADELLKHVEAGVITPYPPLSIYGSEGTKSGIWDLAKVDTKGEAKREAERLANCYLIGLDCPMCL